MKFTWSHIAQHHQHKISSMLNSAPHSNEPIFLAAIKSHFMCNFNKSRCIAQFKTIKCHVFCFCFISFDRNAHISLVKKKKILIAKCCATLSDTRVSIKKIVDAHVSTYACEITWIIRSKCTLLCIANQSRQKYFSKRVFFFILEK